jgi:hypothetical protein
MKKFQRCRTVLPVARGRGDGFPISGLSIHTGKATYSTEPSSPQRDLPPAWAHDSLQLSTARTVDQLGGLFGYGGTVRRCVSGADLECFTARRGEDRCLHVWLTSDWDCPRSSGTVEIPAYPTRHATAESGGEEPDMAAVRNNGFPSTERGLSRSRVKPLAACSTGRRTVPFFPRLRPGIQGPFRANPETDSGLRGGE